MTSQMTTQEAQGSKDESGPEVRNAPAAGAALRDEIPKLGLREYWYPAVAASKVRKRRPAPVRMLGERLIFFRDSKGEVAATSATCPHRGADMSHGKCHFRGTVSCPYHGWTFDGDGNCVAVLGEGPSSTIPGKASARISAYPTRTVKGIVFVWMGSGEPAPIEEDVPDHLFEHGTLVQHSTRTWRCNWRPAVENLLDAHVFYLHRNSLQLLLSRPKGVIALSKMGPRRPRPKVVNNRGLVYAPEDVPFLSAIANTDESVDEGDHGASNRDGDLMFQDVYPNLGGAKWPKTKLRLYFARLVAPFLGHPGSEPFIRSTEWTNFHLPTVFQVDYHAYAYSRITVPVDEDTSKVFYLFATRPTNLFGAWWDRFIFWAYLDWKLNSNFSNQDKRVVEAQDYGTHEKLSATDVFPLEIRRLIVKHGRKAPDIRYPS